VISGGAELGDMCEHFASSLYKPADLGYTIQRTWSNYAAVAFSDPCVPMPPSETAYFAAVPDAQDTIMLTDGSGIHMPGTNIPIGQTGVVEIDFASSGPTDDWTIDAIEDISTDGVQALDISFDRTTGQNGNLVHATIKTTHRPRTGVAFYIIRSTLGSNKTGWWGAVGVP
jgi:hypothetical protein